MEVKFEVEYIEEVIRKHIPALSIPVRKVVKKAIETKLKSDPLNYGKPLRYTLKGYRSFRVGDYRVIYKIDSTTIVVIAIKHRKRVYDI